MTQYKTLRKMLEDCGWEDVEEQAIDDMIHQIYLHEMSETIIRRYGVDAVADAMVEEPDEVYDEVKT